VAPPLICHSERSEGNLLAEALGAPLERVRVCGPRVSAAAIPAAPALTSRFLGPKAGLGMTEGKGRSLRRGPTLVSSRETEAPRRTSPFAVIPSEARLALSEAKGIYPLRPARLP